MFSHYGEELQQVLIVGSWHSPEEAYLCRMQHTSLTQTGYRPLIHNWLINWLNTTFPYWGKYFVHGVLFVAGSVIAENAKQWHDCLKHTWFDPKWSVNSCGQQRNIALQEATFYLIINVFGVNNTLFSSFFLHACLSNSPGENVFPQRGNALSLTNTAM